MLEMYDGFKRGEDATISKEIACETLLIVFLYKTLLCI